MRSIFLTVFAAVLCAGCSTQQIYDGPRLPRDQVARISGDMRFTAGVPVSVLLRQVDGRTLGASASSVEVMPGSRRLLVDCVVHESRSTSRHTLDVDVVAGQRYRLVAETGTGLRQCTSVRLEQQ